MKARYWIAASAATGGLIAWALAQRPRRPRTFRLRLPEAEMPFASSSGTVQFIGAATTLIRCAGLTILTDPNFLNRGRSVHIGYGLHATRLTDPAIDFEDLPPVDFVLLSHLHEDHFDRLVQRRLANDVPILTTASAARSLRRMGFLRVCGMKPWDAVAVRKGSLSVRVTSMPGTHGPTPVSAMLPDVMGSMLEFHNELDGGEYRIYVSGDTLLFDGLEEIPRRYPDIDLALLHLGGAKAFGVPLTMDAKQGIEALRVVRPDRAIPIHYDDYDVYRSPLEDFQRAVNLAGWEDRVRYLARGGIYTFSPRGARQTVGEHPLA